MQDPPDKATLVIFILIFAGIMVGALIWLAKKIRQKKTEDDLALKEFADEIKKEFMLDTLPPREMGHPPLAPDSSAPYAPPAPALQNTPPILAGQMGSAPSPESPVAALISRLRAVNLLQSEEGPYMTLDPTGTCVMVRLKKNKTALIVPRFESEHFINMALQRLDYVFMIIGGEKVIMLNKIEDYLASQWEMK